MGTTFETLYTVVRTNCGLKSDDDSLIKSYINDRYKAVIMKFAWPFVYTKTTLLTTAKYSTGTVTTNGTTTITGSGMTFTSAMVGRKFKVTGFEEVYTISTYVSATQITLDNAFNGSDSTTNTYEIFQDLISLPSDCALIVALRQARTPIELTPVGIRELFDYDPIPTLTNTDPVRYAYYKLAATTNYQQIMLHPPPYRQIVLDLEYKKVITELSATTDEPLIPEQYRDILKFGAMSDVYLGKRDDTKDTRYLVYESKYNNILSVMLSKYGNTDDVMRIIPENKRTSRGTDLQTLANKYDLGEYFDIA